MNALSRPIATLVAAAAAGFGLWLAGHWDTDGNGGYWAALGVVALAGLLIGLAQLRSPDGNAPGMFLFAFVPIAIVAGWVLVATQPDANTFRDHVRGWDNDLGLADVVHYLMPFAAVLAFGIGLVFGLTLLAGYVMRRTMVTTTAEPVPPARPVPTRRTVPATTAPPAPSRYVADEPVAAERAEVDEETVVAEAPAERAEVDADRETVVAETASGRRSRRASMLDRMLHR